MTASCTFTAPQWYYHDWHNDIGSGYYSSRKALRAEALSVCTYGKNENGTNANELWHAPKEDLPVEEVKLTRLEKAEKFVYFCLF